jgi:8-oxo-dGTP pyrophosphatase MutT (NUDIX family)
MDPFDRFLDHLAARLDPVVSGGGPARPGEAPVHAAVALLLRPVAAEAGGADAELLFIRRAERDGDPWSGHIAFPGGRPETRDATLLDVAARETLEEVGIDIRSGRVLGRLPTLRPSSVRIPPIDVTPFVALAPPGSVVRPQPEEVDDAFWLSLAALARAGTTAAVSRRIRGEQREWPAYPSPRGPIWGITERILTGFIALLR